jgi:hypothetical protein
VIAAIVKAFAMVVYFIIVSFAFYKLAHSGRRSFRPPVLLPLVQAEADGKSGHVFGIFFAPWGERVVHWYILC